MTLPTSTLAALEAASRAFLSPLAFADADAWRRRVMAAVCELLGAESATFGLPSRPTAVLVHQLSGAASEAMNATLGPVYRWGGPSGIDALDRFFAVLRQVRLGAWDLHVADGLIGGGGAAWHNPWVQDVLAPHGAGDLSGLYVPRPGADVLVSVHGFARTPTPGQHVPLLAALHPSLAAGLDALDRLGAHRAALDATAEPLAAFSPDARETHRTPALARLLLDDPEAMRIEAAIADAARRTRPLAFARRADEAAPPIATVEVQTARATYTLRPALLASASAFGDAFLVTVAARGIRAAIAPAEVLRQRHGLTAREAEVVALVAEGLSNVAIGERLFLSRHTVRHHVETAAQKLGLTGAGRGAITAALIAG